MSPSALENSSKVQMPLLFWYLGNLLRFSYDKYTSFLICLQSNSIYFVSDAIPFLYGCKSGYYRYNCYGNDAPIDCRNGNEKHESGQIIWYGMRKAKPFGVGQCYYLIANLDGDDYWDTCKLPWHNVT